MNAGQPLASPLLVSIPGSALTDLKLPGSVFAWRDLRDAVLPPDLRLALRLVMEHAAAARLRVRFLARPEIFTHGAPRAWLDARIAGSTDHLILSDGRSLRPIPGFGAHRMPVRQLYLCGSGSHPGGYVSGLPGRNCATVVLRDLRQ